MPKILVIQGANMNWLGKRQPELYGTTTAAELDGLLRRHAEEHGYELEIFYTNIEGEALNRIYRAVEEGVDALLMNPGGFTFTGYALRDCILGTRIPYVEVHIKNHYLHHADRGSVIGAAAQGVIMGLGIDGYLLGLHACLRLIGRER